MAVLIFQKPSTFSRIRPEQPRAQATQRVWSTRVSLFLFEPPALLHFHSSLAKHLLLDNFLPPAGAQSFVDAALSLFTYFLIEPLSLDLSLIHSGLSAILYPNSNLKSAFQIIFDRETAFEFN